MQVVKLATVGGLEMKLADITVEFEGSVHEVHQVALPLEIGRQQNGEDLLKVYEFGDNQYRLAVAPNHMLRIPRRACKLENDVEGGVRVTNIHPQIPFQVGDEQVAIEPLETYRLASPGVIHLPNDVCLRVSVLDGDDFDIDDLSLHTLQSFGYGKSSGQFDARLSQLLVEPNGAPAQEQDAAEVAVNLVRLALKVVQKAAGSNEFFDLAVRTAAKMIDLDRAFVILRNADQWSIRSQYESGMKTSLDFHGNDRSNELPSGSGKILNNVLMTRKPVIYEPEDSAQAVRHSMMLLDRAVAAPMLNDRGRSSECCTVIAVEGTVAVMNRSASWRPLCWKSWPERWRRGWRDSMKNLCELRCRSSFHRR
ncbi:MAG: hypothetical protein R3C05_00750 [Pirellulaceae bacterium]